MAEKKGYTISDLYQGGYSSFNPTQTSYVTAGSLGMTTDPRTANILQEVSSKLSSGVKNIEIEAVSPEVFDSIPRQQLREVHRLSKLTGVDISMHAPVMDVSGIDPRSGFSEGEREISERRVTETLLRAHELNPEGNINVNFHSAEGIPGSQFLPPSKREKEGEYKRLIVVSKESGRLAPLEPEVMYYPRMEELEKGEKKTPKERMEILNETEWDNSINQIFFNEERAKELLDKTKPFMEPILDPNTGTINYEEIKHLPAPEQKKIAENFIAAHNYIQDVHQHANALFSKAWEYGTEEQRNELKRISEELKSDLEKGERNPFAEAEAMENLLNKMKNPKITPEIYVPIEEFAIENSSKSFGNAAWKAYKKLKGKNVPILAIENPPAGFALSTGDDIRKIVDKSREQFVKNATKSIDEGGMGMSESNATAEAEKLIGATWDVGHINMLRKFGYSEKEVVKEAEKVAPVLKHVHLSDNFGYEHTELPMGMGNVPFKQIMEKLGQKGYDAKKIIEAAGWWQHFKNQPFQESLEAIGSPIYGMKMAPYWNQAPGLYQGYAGGLAGNWLPQINYETFGSGFSRLPSELGGQVQGGQGGRMSGRPME